MSARPVLDKKLDSKTFRDFYYLKEELIEFCRNNNLPTSGGKLEVTERIACFLDTGEVLPVSKSMRKKAFLFEIREDMEIEIGFVCTERHRAFFKEYIGTGFSFNTEFQRWLKNNAGKTYAEAITAYDQICKDRKNKKKRLISNLNITHISGISFQIIKESRWRVQLYVGNIKSNCRGITDMRGQTLLH